MPLNTDTLRKYRITVLVLFILTSLTISNLSQAATKQTNSISQIIQQFKQNINIGVNVVNIKSGQTIYSYNADRYFTPASTLKIFTAVAALIQLGPDYRYTTSLYSETNKVRDGVITGDLYFHFTGDPELGTSNLRKMIARLQKFGVTKIKGNIYIDNTHYDNKGIGPGWMWDDINICFSAPVNAIILNHNCFYGEAGMGDDTGASLKMKYLPNPSIINFNVKAISGGKSDSHCALDLTVSNKNVYTLTGCMTRAQSPQMLSMAIKNPMLYAQNLIAYLFKEANIKHEGKIGAKKLPATNMPLLAQHKSAPLVKLIATMLKESDNMIANSLFKSIGASYYNTQGNWQNSQRAVKKILAKAAKLDLKHAKIVDGSGSSRYNVIRPNDLVKLLKYSYQKLNTNNYFMRALAISGQDGTLKGRLRDKDTLNKVRAKTGTLANVSGLAGFINTQNKNTLAFAIIINGYTGSRSQIKQLEDNICRRLIAKQ